MRRTKPEDRNSLSLEFHLILALIAALGVSHPAAAQVYTVTDLGSLGGGESWAFQVSNWSSRYGGPVVVGRSKNAAGAVRAFFYTTTMTSLGSVGGSASEAWGIAPGLTSRTVGNFVTLTGATHGALWIDTSAGSDLGTLGGTNSWAGAVNSNGWIAGQSEVVGGDTHVWVRSPGGVNTDCGTAGGHAASVGGINNKGTSTQRGDIVGASTDGGGVYRAFVSYGNISPCRLDLLPALAPGTVQAWAHGINGLGNMVGFSEQASSTTTHAVYWSHSGTHPITDMGTLTGGAMSQAYSINVASEAVGTSQNASGDFRAIKWSPSSGMVDLNTLIPAGTGWVLQFAMSISDDGYIAGRGTLNGTPSAFLLSL